MFEVLEHELTQHGYPYTVTQCLYQASAVKVVEARRDQHLIVVKDVQFPNTYPYEKAAKEAEFVMKLDHPHIIKVYSYFWYVSSPNTNQLVIIYERFPKDLMKEITDRKRNSYMWSSGQLLDLFSQVSSAFAYLQFQGISHRDIKPQNILVSSSTLKVADFGTTKDNLISSLHTVTGTPFFLSPKLKEGLLDRQAKVTHNVIKSDVYSLGLTFLTMAKLDPPSSLAKIRSLLRTTEQEIEVIPYDDTIKNVIRVMLAVDEDNRCDFLQLDEYLKKLKEQGYAPQWQVVAKRDCCEHISQGAEAVIYMPCHGNLCSACVSVVPESSSVMQYICKLCNGFAVNHTEPPALPAEPVVAAPVLQVPAAEPSNFEKHQQEVGDSDVIDALPVQGIECRECRIVKSRALLLPVNDKLLCTRCLDYYEKYEKYHYGSPFKRV